MCDYKKQPRVAYTGPTDVKFPLKYMSRNLYEEENLTLTEQLKEKIKVLKSFSIEIGAELRYQTALLNKVDDEFDKTESALRKSVTKLFKVLRARYMWYPIHIVIFSLSVFFIIIFLGIRAKIQLM